MKIVIGVDEVGRGPLAGPVAVGAFCFLDARGVRAARAFGVPLRDSKRLSREQRELWFAEIRKWQKEGKCLYKVTMISARMIDKIGIAPAIRLALKTSLISVTQSASELSSTLSSDQFHILLDGGLKAPHEFKKQKTIVKGDETEPAISLASIVAKVTRDRHMLREHKKFHEYGFDTHVGYGTPAHRHAIKKHGLLPIHRRSFLKKLA